MCHKCDVNVKRNLHRPKWFIRVDDHIMKGENLVYKICKVQMPIRVQHRFQSEWSYRGEDHLPVKRKGSFYLPGLQGDL